MSSAATPDAETLLRAIAAVAPGLWFPVAFAEQSGTTRDALTEPLWLLRQTGLIEVADWVKGRGQGFRLTPDGERAVQSATPLAVRPSAPPPTRADAAPTPTTLERGDGVRESVFDPPPAVVAPALLYANLAWFAVGAVLAWRGGVGLEFLKGDGHPGVVHTLFRTGAVTASSVWGGDWWRLISTCFVHVGLLHLFCNMLSLGAVGPFAEGLWGRWRFALIYAVSGLVGSVTAIALHPLAESGAEALLAGASGALWGMLAGVVVWVVRFRRHLPPEFTREFARKLPFTIVVNLVVSFMPGISAEAHFGGGLAGGLVAWAVAKGHRRPRLTGAGGVAFVLLLATLLLAGASRWSEGWKAVKERERFLRLVADAARASGEAQALHAAVGDDWTKLSPKEATALRAWFDKAQPARNLTKQPGPATLRSAAEALRQRAVSAAGRVPMGGEFAVRVREYFDALVAFAAAVRDETDRPGRLETPEVDAAWAECVRAAGRVGRWE